MADISKITLPSGETYNIDAVTVDGHTIQSDVPANAVFTDTKDLNSMTGTLPVNKGGTGGTSAATARTNLGLGSVAVKDVDVAIAKGSSSTNIPTTAAIASFVERQMPKNSDISVDQNILVVQDGEEGEGGIQVDQTLTVLGMPADAKAVGDKVNELKEDLEGFCVDVPVADTWYQGYINNSNGAIGSDSQSCYTGIFSAYEHRIAISVSDGYKYKLAEYDSNGTFIRIVASLTDASGIYDTISGHKYRLQITKTAGNLSPSDANDYITATLENYTDTTLSISGKMADAKATGDGLNNIAQDFNDITSTETYQTDTIESVTYESGYVSRSGSSSSGDYVHTNKIPVNKGDRIYLVFAVSGNLGSFRIVTAYDTNDVAIYASGAENTPTAGYTVPDGVASVILSISGTDTTGAPYAIHIVKNITQNVIDTQSAKDLLFGKKWCVIGDSFSYGGQSVMPVFVDGKYAGCRKVYPYFIGNRTHINIIDFTANGRTLAYPSDGSFSNSLTNPSADYYYQNIPADVDFITIYLGINDSHHAPSSSGGDGEDNTGAIPIGTVDDSTTATFGGAWNVVLSWLITNRPKAHIGIIVSNGVDSVAYRNLTIDIAKKYGIAYIDLNGDERTPAMIRTVNPDIASAVKTALINKWAVEVGVNTHPNTDAHEYESYFIENFLRSI